MRVYVGDLGVISVAVTAVGSVLKYVGAVPKVIAEPTQNFFDGLNQWLRDIGINIDELHYVLGLKKRPVFSSNDELLKLINELYVKYLNRNMTQRNVDHWFELLMYGDKSLSDLEKDILASVEYQEIQKKVIFAEQIVSAYQEILRRDPDPQGAKFYFNEMMLGKLNYEQLRQVLLESEEFKKIVFEAGVDYSDPVVDGLIDNYRQVLKREPTGEEVEVWYYKLKVGIENISSMKEKLKAEKTKGIIPLVIGAGIILSQIV